MADTLTRREHAGGAAITTLSAPITSASTSFNITNPAGWPTGAVGPFFVVLDAGTTAEEKVICSDRTGSVVTVQGGVAGRGQDGTSATGHSASGGPVYPCWTATEADELNAHGAATTHVHGVAGAVVGTTDTQTVSGKTHNTSTWSGGTFTGTIAGSPTFSGAPGLADFTNMGHTHAAAASAGLLPTAAPTASAVGDTSVTGTATTYSRTDHKHAREGFGAVTAQTSFGLGSSNGAATTLARSDHTHGTPANPIRVDTVKTNKTSNTSCPGSSVTTTIVTAPAITTDGSTQIHIHGQFMEFSPSGETGPHTIELFLREGSTVLATVRMRIEDASINDGGVIDWVLTPSAASHTYNMAVSWGGANSGNVLASSTGPSQIYVEQTGL